MKDKGKIGVLIEEHFDPTEYLRFNEFFPQHGYTVEYISRLWGQPSLRFGSNPENGVVEHFVTVTTDVDSVNPADYKAIILIGAYAMDRLRYQESVRPGQPNTAPAVVFVRKAMQSPGVKIGTICHSIWLLCADPALLKGRKVTCAHNIVCDVENAGAEVVYEGDQTATVVVDGNLITGKHPGTIDAFLEAMLETLEEQVAVC
jgi:putative intracellular protease/amidase